MRTKGIFAGTVLLLLAVLSVLTLLFVQQGAALRELENQNAALAQQSTVLDELCAVAKELPIGYSNESFRVSKSVIVMKSGESCQLKLTANWKGGGRVHIDCSSDAAALSFDEENWESYTTMTVQAVHPGVTVARFSSDASDRTFAVWILVES